VLARLQRGLERLYRIETRLEVDDFVIDADERERLGVARMPREQLLVAQDEDALSLGLFVDRDSLANLERHDPASRLDERNLQDFLFAVEGVSHFVYVAWRAQSDRPMSALELELQGEIDKYVTCVLTTDAANDGDRAHALRRRLFEEFELEPDLAPEERDRYREANAQASRYSHSLIRRFLRPRRVLDMLAELRRFYRLDLTGKVDLIRAAA
jgi:hypothetical protein